MPRTFALTPPGEIEGAAANGLVLRRTCANLRPTAGGRGCRRLWWAALAVGAPAPRRTSQAAFPWCHDGGQSAVFTAVRGRSLTSRLMPELQRRTSANTRGSLVAALAVWGSGVRVPSAPPR